MVAGPGSHDVTLTTDAACVTCDVRQAWPAPSSGHFLVTGSVVDWSHASHATIGWCGVSELDELCRTLIQSTMSVWHSWTFCSLYWQNGKTHHTSRLEWRKKLLTFPNIYILDISVTLISQLDNITRSLKYFHNLSSWRIVDELVDQPLAIDLGKDAPLIVIPQRSPHRLVVHVGLVLVQSPQPGDRLRVDQLEDSLLPVGPLDVPRAALLEIVRNLISWIQKLDLNLY